MPKNKHMHLLLILAYAAVGLMAAWLFFQFALPWLAPFILAFITATMIEPAVGKLMKKYNFQRGFAAACCTILITIFLLALIVFLTGRAAYEITAFVKSLPSILSRIPAIASTAENALANYIAQAPQDVQNYFLHAIDSISTKISELPAALSGELLGLLSKVLAAAPKIFLFAVTYAIGIFFISSRYREITAFILRQIPQRWQAEARAVKQDLFSTLLKWLKAQLTLMCITFLELTAAFFIIKIDYAALLALLIALIDALPILGVGTVLIPWALIELLCGNMASAVSLIVIYGIVALVRSLLEPKLVGSQIGLSPIVTLISMYVGFCSAGILGMILFPIAVIMLKQFNDKGYIKLWK